MAKRARSAVQDWLETACARSLLALLRALPDPLAQGVCRLVASLLDLAIPKWRRTARRNLELALGDRSRVEREAIVDGVFRNLARVLFAVSRFPRLHSGNIDRWIRYEGFEHFRQAMSQGRGVLFATAHLGNWELSAFAHALMTAPMHVVVRPLDNSRLDDFVETQRSLSGNRIIGKKDYARSILKALRSNEAVGILLDQNHAGVGTVFVNFFGVPAATGSAFARLAHRSGAAVIPGWALWSEEEGRYVLHFEESVPMTGYEDADMEAIYGRLERAIRNHPDQWLWIHRRWKTRPPGEPPLY